MKLVILDRDGVINEDSDAFVKSVAEWRPLPGSADAVGRLCRAGYTVAIATNQSGLARGLLDRATLDDIHAEMVRVIEQAGGHIARIEHCPHGPDDGCACRKPRPGMIDAILAALAVPDDCERWIVGDSLRDIEAGLQRGCRPVLVRTGKGARVLADPATVLPDGCIVVDDLAAFADLACGGHATGETP